MTSDSKALLPSRMKWPGVLALAFCWIPAWPADRLALATPMTPPPASPRWTAHLKQLQPKIPAGFSMVESEPFVVVGDLDPALLRQISRQTVQGVVASLKKAYFTQDPDQIIDVWLFKDAASYTYHAKALFGDTPTSPYGYYSPQHQALIMNIATGGGTLVHEIVHPFMAANFPDCPPWFNEGLASLYEQSTHDPQGGIKGLTNWRLPGLQKAIAGGGLPSFAELTSMDSKTFYGEGSGTHYAQARYLCYYLQEQGLLKTYYHEFLAARKEDPTGHATLARVLKEKDMKEFQKRWEKYVAGLTFP